MPLPEALPEALPEDAPSLVGRYEHPTNDPQPPVGTMPTGPHAEAEAAALQAVHSGTEPRNDFAGALIYMPPGATQARTEAEDRTLAWQEALSPEREPARETVPRLGSSDTPTGRVLAEIDNLIGDSLGQRNQALRRQLRDATGELARERALRQDAQVRLAQVTAERDGLAVKLAETERALRVLGAAVRHAIGHDEKGGE